MNAIARMLTVACVSAALSLAGPSSRAQTLENAFAESRCGLDFRHRIELVDEDGFAEAAEAPTLRTRLNLKTGNFRGLSAFVEFFDVREIGLGNLNAGAAFRTPLARLHTFNGRADRFLATPDTGLDDLHAGFTSRHGRFSCNLTWHRFESERTDLRFGQELDGSLSIALAGHVDLLLKLAHFDSSAIGIAGATKLWAQLNVALT